MDLREVMFECVKWMQLAGVRVQRRAFTVTVLKLQARLQWISLPAEYYICSMKSVVMELIKSELVLW